MTDIQITSNPMKPEKIIRDDDVSVNKAEDTDNHTKANEEIHNKTKIINHFDTLMNLKPIFGCCCCIAAITNCFPMSSTCELFGIALQSSCCECLEICIDCCEITQCCGVDQCSGPGCQGGKCCHCNCQDGHCCGFQCCSIENICCFKCCTGKSKSSCCQCCQSNDSKPIEAPITSPHITGPHIIGPTVPTVQVKGPELPKFVAPKVRGHCLHCSCCPKLKQCSPGCNSNQECCGFNNWICDFGCPCSNLCKGSLSIMGLSCLCGSSVPCILNLCGCTCAYRYSRTCRFCTTIAGLNEKTNKM